MSRLPAYKFIAVIIALLLLTGLLWSRAVLSLAIPVAFLYSIIHIYRNKPSLKKENLLWGIAPVLFFITGIYQSNDLQPESFDYLLRLSTYPALIFFFFTVDKEQRKTIAVAWVMLAFISLLYPLGWYVLHMQEAYLRYKQGQSLPVFMSGDHVRYGIFVCSALIPLLYEKLFSKNIQRILIVLLSLAIVFIAVRSAWVVLLIVMIIYAAGKIKWTYFIASLLLLSVFAVAAYKFIPTVEQKVNYTFYDWNNYPADKYLTEFSDGARRSVNYVAWKTITEKHRTNVGWNNVIVVLQEEFQLQYPGSVMTYGWPFNQFLYWWLGAGLIGLILFSGWLLYPAILFFKNKNKALLSWSLAIAATCLVESTLNMQYGIFLHAWVIGYAFLLNRHEDL